MASNDELPEEYNDILYDLDGLATGAAEDSYVQDLLYTGWFDETADADSRREAREFLFDYLDIDSGEFDWDSWREWYEAA